MFYGRGAGALPTASAVMGDVISTAQHILNGSTGTGMIMTDTKRIPFYSSLKLQNSYYFRLDVDDVTGVLSQIAAAFAENDISICEVVQKTKNKRFGGVGAYYGTGEPGKHIAGGESSPGTSLYA